MHWGAQVASCAVWIGELWSHHAPWTRPLRRPSDAFASSCVSPSCASPSCACVCAYFSSSGGSPQRDYSGTDGRRTTGTEQPDQLLRHDAGHNSRSTCFKCTGRSRRYKVLHCCYLRSSPFSSSPSRFHYFALFCAVRLRCLGNWRDSNVRHFPTFAKRGLH